MARNLNHACLSACNIKMFIFLSYFIYHTTNIWKKKLDEDQTQLIISFWKLCCLFGSPFAPVFPWLGISCYVDSGAGDIRLESARLFYLCRFSFVVHSKYIFPAFCMNYEAKFTEVKQARWVTPEFTCSWISVTILSMSMLWSVPRVNHNKIGFLCF